MNARIPAQKRLSSDVVAIIEQLAQERAREYARIEIEKQSEKLFWFHMMLFSAHNHKLYGHAEKRAMTLIESVIHDKDSEDADVLLKHTLEYMKKIGLTFLVEEWEKA